MSRGGLTTAKRGGLTTLENHVPSYRLRQMHQSQINKHNKDTSRGMREVSFFPLFSFCASCAFLRPFLFLLWPFRRNSRKGIPPTITKWLSFGLSEAVVCLRHQSPGILKTDVGFVSRLRETESALRPTHHSGLLVLPRKLRRSYPQHDSCVTCDWEIRSRRKRRLNL
jgi:hypothetical protein